MYNGAKVSVKVAKVNLGCRYRVTHQKKAPLKSKKLFSTGVSMARSLKILLIVVCARYYTTPECRGAKPKTLRGLVSRKYPEQLREKRIAAYGN
jgi:hypothetical protein